MTSINADGKSDRTLSHCHTPIWRQAVAAVRRVFRSIYWYLEQVSGQGDYQRYVDHLRQVHPEVTPPTVDQYWRERYAEQERNPGARCC
jgi:uncharacterized short protein YbdD (DUF466 family)